MAPAMNPRTVCFCQPIFCMISIRVAPPLRCSIATTWAVLLPSRGAAASCGFAAFLPGGGFLAVVAVWPVFAVAGAPLAPRAPRLALAFAFGSVLWPRPWMRAHTWPAATLWFGKRFTGLTPARLFQIATSLSLGQEAASSPHSCGLVKLSKGVAVVVAASSAVANATISFWSLMVNVVIMVLPFVRAVAVMDMDHSGLLEKQGNWNFSRRLGRSARMQGPFALLFSHSFCHILLASPHPKSVHVTVVGHPPTRRKHELSRSDCDP